MDGEGSKRKLRTWLTTGLTFAFARSSAVWVASKLLIPILLKIKVFSKFR